MAIRESLIAALESFQVGAQADDTALVVMRRSPEGSRATAQQTALEPAIRV